MSSSTDDVDAVIVGGGQGGIYTAYRFVQDGRSVIGFDGGSNFGGVWCHNRYPGARIDSDSVDYCFQFSAELYRGWHWPERYADADALYRYLNYAADHLDVRQLFRFNTWVREANWSSDDKRWHVTTDQGDRVRSRFLVMCSGVLSEPKHLVFPGVARFKGEWLRTSRWPEGEVDLRGKRVGIIGTGSSGVQAVPEIAKQAEHLWVFQRSPHYAIPAQNRPTEPGLQEAIADDLDERRSEAFHMGGPSDAAASNRLRARREPARPAASYSRSEQLELLEEQWEYGGHGMSYLFADEATNPESNEIVAAFLRMKTHDRLKSRELADQMCPQYPIGTKRLILDIGYYEAFTQDNVSLVNVVNDPLVEITESGIRTVASHYPVDVLIFAIGFDCFAGALQSAGIRNEEGGTPTDVWADGPRTVFGLMTPGFPNLFHPTNVGSPSVLGNSMIQHEFFGDWMAECISYIEKTNRSTIDASSSAAEQWMHTVDQYAQQILPIRRSQNQYMVHVNPDGTRYFKPFCAGMGEYVPKVLGATQRDYEGFHFS